MKYGSTDTCIIHGRRALALCISARHRLPKAGRFSLPLVRSILARPRKRDLRVPSRILRLRRQGDAGGSPS